MGRNGVSEEKRGDGSIYAVNPNTDGLNALVRPFYMVMASTILLGQGLEPYSAGNYQIATSSNGLNRSSEIYFTTSQIIPHFDNLRYFGFSLRSLDFFIGKIKITLKF